MPLFSSVPVALLGLWKLGWTFLSLSPEPLLRGRLLPQIKGAVVRGMFQEGAPPKTTLLAPPLLSSSQRRKWLLHPSLRTAICRAPPAPAAPIPLRFHSALLHRLQGSQVTGDGSQGSAVKPSSSPTLAALGVHLIYQAG